MIYSDHTDQLEKYLEFMGFPESLSLMTRIEGNFHLYGVLDDSIDIIEVPPVVVEVPVVHHGHHLLLPQSFIFIL